MLNVSLRNVLKFERSRYQLRLLENFEQNKTGEKDYKLGRLHNIFARCVMGNINFFSAAELSTPSKKKVWMSREKRKFVIYKR